METEMCGEKNPLIARTSPKGPVPNALFVNWRFSKSRLAMSDI